MLQDLEKDEMIYKGPQVDFQNVNHDSVRFESTNQDFESKKYSIFHLYKWTTILYQMAMVYELIIVPLFWTVIFPGYLIKRDIDVPEIDDFQTLD